MMQRQSARTALIHLCALASAALFGAVVSAACGDSGGDTAGAGGTNAPSTGPDAGDAGDADAASDTSDDADAMSDASTDGTSVADAPTDADAASDAAPDDASDAPPSAKWVTLKTAGNFVVLAGQTVTNTGFTVINGDVGISPGSAITGFPPGIVNGIIHSADAVAAQAKQDLNDAYTFAAAQSGAPIPLVGDLGGMTLGPGLYVSGSSMGLDSGSLTLDASGNQDAIWVFQISSTFIAMVNRGVTLIHNAKPDNVFWSVGSSATIGVGVFMVGNFLTQTSISVQTGATMEGRFLTQTGAVTFDSNTVNKPPPIVHQ